MDNEILQQILGKLDKLDKLSDDVAKLSGDVTKLTDDVTKLTGNVTDLNKRFDTLEKDVSVIKEQTEKVPLIWRAVQETNNDVMVLKGDVKAVKESVSHLEAIQKDQQRIIDLLSVRSLQQEADLKRIK